jgi:hypothetical protein
MKQEMIADYDHRELKWRVYSKTLVRIQIKETTYSLVEQVFLKYYNLKPFSPVKIQFHSISRDKIWFSIVIALAYY